ncbi:MAG: isoprenoid biosynthesis glyoxalase ElbB [Bdellovibrionales bacterium]|nr:isoprenoid biosynthesis glyoxalase ElbB [Bdellovibrionales bacterium]
MKKNVAVILCGSGFKDGSEIRESVAVLWALSRHGAGVEIFAPDEPQRDVINCLTGRPMQESRNQLVEAARIARGNIKPLSGLDPGNFHALVLPGGFGAAKNLCSFAFDGSKGSVHPTVQKVTDGFHGKPIGAVCIAPAILALAWKGKGLELTVGEAGEAAAEIEKLGHRHVVKTARECHVDRRHRVVSTPAYMYDGAALHEIFEGVESLVKEVLALI